jgi:hypothetical protein
LNRNTCVSHAEISSEQDVPTVSRIGVNDVPLELESLLPKPHELTTTDNRITGKIKILVIEKFLHSVMINI